MKRILVTFGTLALLSGGASAQMITDADDAICRLATTVEGYVQGHDLVLYTDTAGVPLRVSPTGDSEVVGDLVDTGEMQVRSQCLDGTFIAFRTEMIVADMASVEEAQSN